MSKKLDLEIGDSVVFAKPVKYCDSLRKWRAGRVVDVAGDIVEIEFRSLFGFFRRKWVQPGLSRGEWMIQRKDRADEMIARYTAKD